MGEGTISFGYGDKELDEHRLSEFLENVTTEAAAAGARERKSRQDFQALLGQDYAPIYDAMDTLYAAAIEAAQWSADTVLANLDLDDEEDRAFADLNIVLRGIASRAMSVFAEVAWLLRGGYGSGASARTRTMHELALTALVMIEYGRPDGSCPDLAARYAAHHDCFLVNSADDLLRGRDHDSDVSASIAQLRDPDLRSQLHERRDRLIRAYGASFGRGMWGWANALFPDAWKVTAAMMSDKASGFGFDGLHFLYGEASVDVHAGSDGWHRTFQTWGDTTVLTSGASSRGLRMPAHMAATFLVTTLATVIPTSIESGDQIIDTGGYFAAALRNLSAEVGRLTESREDT